MRFPWQKEENELDREVQYHLDALVEQYRSEGMSETDAKNKARREFGGATQVKDECRDESAWAWVTSIRQDTIFGWRMIKKTPVVSAAAVLSLAIGIGSNTAIFSLMQEALFNTIAVPKPQEVSLLVWNAKVRARDRADRTFGGASGGMYPENGGIVADFFSGASYDALRTGAAPKGRLAAYMFPDSLSFSYQGQTQVIQARPVAGEFFHVLELQPFAGRLFTPEDDKANSTPTVVVSHRYWRTALSSDLNAVGRNVRISNGNYQIIGVLPREFGGISTGEDVQAYLPIHQTPRMLAVEQSKFYDFNNRMNWFLQIIGRRAPGVTNEEFSRHLDHFFPASWSVQPRAAETIPHVRSDDGSQGLGDLRRRFKQPMYVLFGLAGIMLLIACANIANLMLARADARRKEAAVRLSLGCSQGRLLRQFLTESALLAMLGGLLSVVFAVLTARALVTLTPSREPLLLDIGLNVPLLLFTMVATILTTAIFGVFPALRAARFDTSPALKEGGGSAGGAGHSWWTPGKVLVVAQVAFALILAASAALFTRNLQRIVNTDAGFERGNMIVFDIKPGQTGYQGDNLRRFYRDVEQRLQATQGVESAALAEVRPMNSGGHWNSVRPAGEQKTGAKDFEVALNRITPAYFKTLGIRMVAGREFRPAEAIANATACVLSESLALKFGPGTTILGRSIMFGERDATPMEVVGIASDANYSDLKRRPDVIYLPASMESMTATIIVRTSAPPSVAFPFIRETMRKADPNLPLVDPYTMEQLVNNGLRSERMFAYLCGSFGILAVVLSAIGLYGVISYAVARRKNEIGIRMALGATQPAVVQMVLRDGLILTVLGVLLGAPAVYYGSQFVEKALSDMKALDPTSLIGASVALLVAAFVAALLPSLRAAAMDPVRALRQE